MMSNAIFDEIPSPIDKHVLNYLELLGAALRNYRRTHPTVGLRSTERFSELKISPYFSSGITRKTLAAAETGKPSASMGIYAAILQEMGVWPDIIHALGSSQAEDVRYIEIVINALRDKEKERRKKRLKTLNTQFFNDIG